MKFLLLAISLFISACASNIKTSQPVSGVNSPIRVIGTGYTMEQAKNNGFTSAIEIAVGAVVLTDVEVKGNTLVRDEIIKHSAGYVDDYTFVEQSYANGKYVLVMDVNVKSSRIHERLLGISKSSGNLEGERLSNQYNTYMNDRISGDQILNRLLSDFPTGAMTITQSKNHFVLDGKRNPVLLVPYEIRWNYRYLKAMNEVLQMLEERNGDRPDSVTIKSKDPDAWLLGESNTYRFSDGVRYQRIMNGFSPEIKIQMKIFAENGEVIYSACYSSSQTFRGNYSSSKYIIFGNDIERDYLRVDFDEILKLKIKDAVKIDLALKGKTCA